MSKNKKIVLLTILIVLSILSPYKISKNKTVINTITTELKKKDNSINYIKEIGALEIPKINLKRNIYDPSSKLNDVDKNVTIIKETISSNENGLIILAAHSGNNYNSFFDNLDKLKVTDTVYLTYKDKKYQYQVTSIYEEKRTGYINIKDKNVNRLILTTCSKNKGKQLIIECEKK